MAQATGVEAVQNDAQDSNAPEETIHVSVRLRPLNERELANNDVPDWECINNTTIIFKNSLGERSMYPTAYTFDRVFSADCTTRQVYEEAAKRVALSVVSGINSSIFAYGQTSSGKTYTMSGVTEYTVADIYDYINKNAGREFVLKFSALEIYNEAVRDLLSADTTPLRLLDDPERGTVVDKLLEVTLRDWNHLKELLAICEAQRKIGETSLNEMSSRSHQILRLTVESSACGYRSSYNSSTLAASVHFVDLAGSERASQTLSVGTRLKEGSHINRSLLTLGTVIRKLSKGRNGHVPYRDSKLTRILQNSLGGNARTAIICTMSPARSHVEQSRNALLFASCARQVSTNACVNVVMSEKALIKQLQKEIARLESQLKSLGSLATSFNSLALQEKELLIEKMHKEIRELTNQHDESQSRLESLLRSTTGEQELQRPWDELSIMSVSQDKGSWADEHSVSEASEIFDPLRLDVATSMAQFSERDEGLDFAKYTEQLPEPLEEQFLSDDISPRMFIEKYFGPDPTHGWEKFTETDPNSEHNCKEVQCIEIDSDSNHKNSNSTSLLGEDHGLVEVGKEQEWETFEPKNKDEEKTFLPIQSHPSEQLSSLSDTETSDAGSLDISRSKSCADLLATIPLSPKPTVSKEDKNPPANRSETDSVGSQEGNVLVFSKLKPAADGERPPLKTSQESFRHQSVNHIQQILQSSGRDEVTQPEADGPHPNDMVLKAKQMSKKLQRDSNDQVNEELDSQQASTNSDWSPEFEKQRMEIIKLWDACNIPLVHRSYFFLVFKGDASDSIYMEVELRRLSFLKTSKRTKQATLEASSIKAINREREMLSKLMLKKLSTREREDLYQKWGIELKTKKRRLQLSTLLWTKTEDMDHIKESAALVSKLVGFPEPSQASKEMVGLTFSTPSMKLRSFSWRPSMPPLL